MGSITDSIVTIRQTFAQPVFLIFSIRKYDWTRRSEGPTVGP